jgi:hypothetical protein
MPTYVADIAMLIRVVAGIGSTHPPSSGRKKISHHGRLQPNGSFFTWITPSGRRYDVTPDAYPI